MKYTEHLLSSFLSSNHTGVISGATAISKTINKETGDAVKLYLVIEDDVVTNGKFQACGSVVLFASMSAILDLIIGKSVDDARIVSEKQIIKEIKQVNRCDYPMVTFAVKALDGAISNYYKKQAKIQNGETVVVKPIKVKTLKTSNAITVYEKNEEEINVIENIIPNILNPIEKKEPVVEKLEVVEELKQAKMKAKAESIEFVPTKIEVRIMDEEASEQEVTNEVLEVSSNQDADIKDVVQEKNEDVIDEIDTITAKLTDAITKLNFKFDMDE